MNLRTRRSPGVDTLAWSAIAGLILLFGVGPLTLMLLQALRDAVTSTTTPSMNARLWAMLARTLTLSLSATVLATLLGAVTGYCLGATAWRGKTVARTLLLLPLAIPPYFHAIAWTTLFRPRGFVAQSLASILDISQGEVSESLYSFPGAAVILALAYFPITMLFCEKSLGLASPSLSETAQLFGANRWQVFCVARWPFIRPALASSAMITFLLASAELGVPTLLKIRVFNFEVLTRIGAFNDVTSAALLSLPLLLVGFMVVLWERQFNLGKLFQADAQDVEPPKQASPSQAWGNRGLLAVVTGLVLVLPFSTLFVDACDFDAMTRMWAVAKRPALNTLFYAISASMLMTLLAFALAWLDRLAKTRQSTWTDWLLIIGFAVPGTILALALLTVYDHPSLSRFVSPTSLVIAALIVRYLIVGYRILASALAIIPGEILETSALDGANSLQNLRYVLFPLTRQAVLSSLAIAFVLSVGEIGSTILLYPPGGETLSIALYSIEANSPRSYVSAMALLQLLVLAFSLAAISLFVRFLFSAAGNPDK